MRRRELALQFGTTYALACGASLLRLEIWILSWLLPYALGLLLIAMIPLAISMFQLVRRLHGLVYAIVHVVLLYILTPMFLTGVILIPLLVHGDAIRLLEDE